VPVGALGEAEILRVELTPPLAGGVTMLGLNDAVKALVAFEGNATLSQVILS